MSFVRYLCYVCLLTNLTACGGGSSDTSSSSRFSSVNSSSVSLSSVSSSISSSLSSSVSSSSSMSSSLSVSSSSSSSFSSSSGFVLISSNFVEGATIPSKLTCDGINVSPQLSWAAAPEATQSFAIIMDDPDAVSVVGYTWVHWNIYNIPAATTNLVEGASASPSNLPMGATEGASSFGSVKYGGPCPPSGRHHYYFALYALNKSSISLSGTTTRSAFETAHAADIIQKVELTGYFR